RYAEQCRLALRNRQWTELARLSQSWSEADPENAEAWLHRAEAAQQRRDFVAADEFLAKVRPTGEFGVRALETRIGLQFGPLNQPLAAVESCLHLLECDANSKVAHQRLIFFYAFTLQRRKLIDEARLAIARESEPREAYGYLFLADALLLSNADSQNVRWLESDPSSELFAVARAVHIAETLEGQIPRDDPVLLANVKKDIERRDRTLQELLQKYPHNLELLAFHLRQAVERGEVARVQELLLQSPAEAEFDNRFWRFRGWLLENDNDLTEAETAYRQALKLHPLDWSTRHLLAALMRRKGELADAERLDQVVLHANQIRREFVQQPTMRAIPPSLLKELAEYAGECDDSLIAETLRAQLSRFSGTTGSRK
ncbi:MAG: Uncharacterized protein FD138_4185, partial [Planctomycetota bacterium]